MKITDYDSINAITADDAFLIDGPRGTKKLLGSYVKNTRDALERYEDPTDGAISDLTVSIDSMTESGRKYIASGTYGGPENAVGLVEAFVSKDDDIVQKWTGLSSNASYTRCKLNGTWGEWIRVDNQNLIGVDWTENTTYVSGDKRLYKNKYYRCKLGHTSSASLTPTNTTYWENTNVSSELPFRFGVDGSGNYGYYKTDGTFVTFKNPSGTKSITSNGTHDVTNYASASVSVQPTMGGAVASNEWYVLGTSNINCSAFSKAVIMLVCNKYTERVSGKIVTKFDNGIAKPTGYNRITTNGTTWLVIALNVAAGTNITFSATQSGKAPALYARY